MPTDATQSQPAVTPGPTPVIASPEVVPPQTEAVPTTPAESEPATPEVPESAQPPTEPLPVLPADVPEAPAPPTSTEPAPAPEPIQENPLPSVPDQNAVEVRPPTYPPTADSGRPEDSPRPGPGRLDWRSLLVKALEKVQFRKRAKLEKIVKFTLENRSITNDQVEKLLHVSDATASRYLSQLVREGKLKKSGKSNSSKYEPSG